MKMILCVSLVLACFLATAEFRLLKLHKFRPDLFGYPEDIAYVC